MDTSSSTPEPAQDPAAPREERLTTHAEQVAGIDLLVSLARERISVFDGDLSRGAWETQSRNDALATFLRTAPNARLEIIVHETRWIETSCPRLVGLLRRFGHAMTLYRTGSGARAAMDPLVIVDARHYLHRYHVDRSRATLAIDMPQ
ncbi:MAG: hypothetical protein ABI812_00725, partial [Betaproteobacteria bacterium]